MLSDTTYTNFTTLVGLSVAFGFGLIYLSRNRKSIFLDVQKQVSKAIRENYVSCLLKRYFMYVAKMSNYRKAPLTMKKASGFLKGILAPVCISPLNIEITCSYLAVTGAISAIYGVVWLFIVPASGISTTFTKSVYMTITICIIVADGIMVPYALFRQMQRVKLFLIGMIILFLANAIGLTMLNHGMYVLSPHPFNRFFLWSMLVPYMPIIVFVGHILLSVTVRLTLFAITLFVAVLMHLVVWVIRKF